MPILHFRGQEIVARHGETVLDACLRNDIDIPHACRSGVCQRCLLKARDRGVSSSAQRGLKPALIEQNYLLACQCVPFADMVLEAPGQRARYTQGVVSEIEALSDDVLRLIVATATPIEYRPGQYVTLWSPEGCGRSYSLASLAGWDQPLEFHIRILPDGRFSRWLSDQARPGDRVTVQEAAGSCFYESSLQEANILLAGVGTGLAPLWGIARDAIRRGHRGEIRLMHGAATCDGLYLHEELTRLARVNDSLHYHASVLNPGALPGVEERPLGDLVIETIGDFNGWYTYLCGGPGWVSRMRRRIFAAGARLNTICADAFLQWNANG